MRDDLPPPRDELLRRVAGMDGVLKASFAKMKPTAMLVNASRGPVVDPDDLYAAHNLLAGIKRQPLPSWVNPEVWQQR